MFPGISNKRIQRIHRITWTGFWINLFLSVGKILAGIFGQSEAMLADGLHSVSDFATDVIVLVFVGISGKAKDHDHQYGHGKYETFATMLVSFALMIVGFGILQSGANSVIQVINGQVLEKPGIVALIAALVSILFKEYLYRITLRVGQKEKSSAAIANAWHHRSDAFTSIGTALGISGAIYLGENWRILDPLAGIIVSFFIMKVAWDLARPSVSELLETALPKETENLIAGLIENTRGVRSFHNLRTRKIGSNIAVEVHVKVDKDLSVELSHHIATEIEQTIRNYFGEQTHIGVHIEPFEEKPQTPPL